MAIIWQDNGISGSHWSTSFCEHLSLHSQVHSLLIQRTWFCYLQSDIEIEMGDFTLKTKTFPGRSRVTLHDDKMFVPSLDRPPSHVNETNTVVYKNSLYTGDPHAPQLGDIRISFFGLEATHVSALGIQSSKIGHFGPKRVLQPFHFPGFDEDQSSFMIVREGDLTTQELLDELGDELFPYPTLLLFARALTPIFVTLAVFGILNRDKPFNRRFWPSFGTGLLCTAAITGILAAIFSDIPETIVCVTITFLASLLFWP